YLNSGQLQTISVPYSHTTYGVHFKDAVTVGGYTFQDLYWDDSLNMYYINTGSGHVNIANSNSPLIPMNVVLGKYVVNISVPTNPLAGQSATFASAYEDVKLNLKSSGYNLDLKNIDFVFDDGSKTM